VAHAQAVEETAGGTFDRHRFDVFISYSRRDAAFARRLQRALSGYTPPADLPVPQRRLRVFRDESDFQGSEYQASLEETLRSAAKLLVICSPRSRASCWPTSTPDTASIAAGSSSGRRSGGGEPAASVRRR
jgi:hypothetical protein